MSISATILKALPTLALSWAAGALWISGSPPFSAPKNPIATSKEHLMANLTAVRDYIKINNEPPYNLNHLRIWSAANGKPFYSFDGYAERFEYARLSKSQYYLRSFGATGQQSNMLESPNPSLLRWGKKSKRGLRYVYPTTPKLSFYPTPLLDSSESPNGVWRAKVFVDNASNKKRLIVRDSRK